MRSASMTLATLVAVSLALVLGVPADLRAAVPTPESVLGKKPGDDFFLASYDESLAYFEQLDAASDRIELVRVGTTSFGADWQLAVISSAENLANLERIREIAWRLAHPEGLTDDEALALAQEGKAVVHIDTGLHATEVAHAQHAIQLAYDLVTADGDSEIEAILDEVVLLLWFSINPDGQNMVVDWYRQNLGTPFEVAPMTRLYQKYVGHDNNRDGYMLNTHESRVTTRVIREWEPQILYNHHQTAPFPTRIWIPPFAEPISPHVHPLMWRTVNLIGMAMAQALEERGQEGAMHMGTAFDNWYPGFMDHANNFHNVAAFLTETGLYRYATPHFYTVADFPDREKNLRPQSLYASPWQGGWWRLRDAVEYMLTASISVLDVAAKYKQDLLFNRYQAGRDVIDYPPRESALRLLRAPGSGRSGSSGRVAQASGAQRHRDPPPDIRDHRRGSNLARRHLGDSHGSTLRKLRASALRHPVLSRSPSVPRGAAGSALRRVRLDSAAADGRPRDRGDPADPG